MRVLRTKQDQRFRISIAERAQERATTELPLVVLCGYVLARRRRSRQPQLPITADKLLP